MGFLIIIDALKAGLNEDTDLLALIDALWPGRSLNVDLVCRHRTEVPLDRLPVIQITRPHRKLGGAGRTGSGGGDHLVRIYAGFYQEDKSKIVRELVQFEEAIEAAILANATLRNLLDRLELDRSANDEGKNHPTAWVVMDFSMDYRPLPTEPENPLPSTVFSGNSPDIGSGHEDDYTDTLNGY